MSNSTKTSNSPTPSRRTELLKQLAARADGWFARARAAALDSLPCAIGCHRCCIGPFPITTIDVDRLREGMASLPANRSADIRARALALVADMEASYPRLTAAPQLDHWADSEVDRLVTDFQHRACPALQPDGSCGVYDWRPVTCRLMGVPVEENGMVHGACQIQTFVPILRVPEPLRQEEQRFAEEEAAAIKALQYLTGTKWEEVLLPYGFLPEQFLDGAG